MNLADFRAATGADCVRTGVYWQRPSRDPATARKAVRPRAANDERARLLARIAGKFAVFDATIRRIERLERKLAEKRWDREERHVPQ